MNRTKNIDMNKNKKYLNRILTYFVHIKFENLFEIIKWGETTTTRLNKDEIIDGDDDDDDDDDVGDMPLKGEIFFRVLK